MNILGLSCFAHDSAACIVRDGRVIAAVEEERLSRCKHDGSFPARAIAAVLNLTELKGDDLDGVVLSGLSGRTAPASTILSEQFGYKGKITDVDPTLALAATTFYASPFDDAAILVVSETDTALYVGAGTSLTPVSLGYEPPLLGKLYKMVTAHLGFEPNEGEYKVMGLASYGKPVYVDLIRRYVEDSLSNATTHLGPPRTPETPIEKQHEDLAASLQRYFEEALVNLARDASNQTGKRFLCLAGGMAHNIVANSHLRNKSVFNDLYIHFASGEDGACLGAALYNYYTTTQDRRLYEKPTPYLGPAYTDAELAVALEENGLAFAQLSEDVHRALITSALTENKVVGWFQGRMEFGPRALGNRSLLASAAAAQMKNILNERVKHREGFRPFAPIVLAERMGEFFEEPYETPTMLFAATVRADKRRAVPAITHVDGTARPQTLRRDDNPLLHDLISAYAEQTGIPLLVNTSFNVRGEPIVCTPGDAIRCFLTTDIDVLVIGPFIVTKN